MQSDKKKIILFSPLGNTDPIRDFHDGAMLHIARYYKPDIIYLYFTKEISETHKKDNRYIRSIELLEKEINKKIQVEIIIDCEAIDAHRFIFYDKFSNYLKKIEEENKDSQILLNISSGTPAMKSILQVISSFSKNKYKAIQVKSPENKSNKDVPHDDNQDFITLWETNEDNKKNENRCDENCTDYLCKLILAENVKKLLNEYDYDAAYMIAKESNVFDEKICKLLNAAKSRLDLNFANVDKEIENDEKRFFYATQDGGKKLLIEYILILKVKIDKKYYSDFIRAITPLITDLFEQFIKKYGISIDNLTVEKNKSNVKFREIDKEKVKKYDQGLFEYLDTEYKGGFRNADLSSDNMLKIIEYYRKKEKIRIEEYDMVNNLREIERKIRNIAAHEIVSITDNTIKEKTTYTTKQIFDKIVKCARIVGIDISDNDLKSYELMNKYINQSMNI